MSRFLKMLTLSSIAMTGALMGNAAYAGPFKVNNADASLLAIAYTSEFSLWVEAAQQTTSSPGTPDSTYTNDYANISYRESSGAWGSITPGTTVLKIGSNHASLDAELCLNYPGDITIQIYPAPTDCRPLTITWDAIPNMYEKNNGIETINMTDINVKFKRIGQWYRTYTNISVTLGGVVLGDHMPMGGEIDKYTGSESYIEVSSTAP